MTKIRRSKISSSGHRAAVSEDWLKYSGLEDVLAPTAEPDFETSLNATPREIWPVTFATFGHSKVEERGTTLLGHKGTKILKKRRD